MAHHAAFQKVSRRFKISRWLLLGTVALLTSAWLLPLSPNVETAQAQQTGGNKPPAKPKTAPNGGNSAASNASGNNSNNSSSLNNGPKIQPKATIQSIPVIQQREPLKPRI